MGSFLIVTAGVLASRLGFTWNNGRICFIGSVLIILGLAL